MKRIRQYFPADPLRQLNRYSAEAAYYTVRSAIPLAAMAVAAAGRLLPLELWTSTLPEAVGDALRHAVERLTRGPSYAVFLSLSALVTLWSAAAGMRALCRACLRLMGEPEPSYANAVLRGFLGAILFSAAFAPILIVFYRFGRVSGSIVALPASLVFCACLTKIFSPRAPICWPRAALTAIGWWSVTALYAWYLATAPQASRLYGSIGALLLFMVYVRACLWLYLFPFVLIRPAPTRPPSARVACPHPKRTAASERSRRTDPRRPSPF